MTARLGVCSWSLQPRSIEDLLDKLRATGLDAVQLALGPVCAGAWKLDELRRRVERAELRILSGMMGCRGEDYTSLDSIRATGGLRPDEHWAENLRAAEQAALAARALGLSLVTFHAGFLPHDPGDPERGKLLGRLRQVADVFGAQGLQLGLETGQETAETLRSALVELSRPNVGVNFDPANMILYGMGDPVRALDLLQPSVRQFHVKDALPARTRGEWGSEVRLGAGQVDWPRFFELARPLGVDFLIEREAGQDRLHDVRAARALVERFVPLSGRAN
jgi:sugar phosphate isomerase/epimerase